MSEYFSSFIVEPVVRQARRLSRFSIAEEPPRFLPAVPDSFRTWYPTRLWNTSPPASASEDENQDDFSRSEPRIFGPWAASMPSPPLDAMDAREQGRGDERHNNAPTPAPFPPLEEPQVVEHSWPRRQSQVRANSDSSINPLRELPDRSRILEEDLRGHSASDPVTRVREESGASGGSGSAVMARAYYENDAQGRSRHGSGTLPEDDGMGPLRQKINAIWQGEGTVESKSQKLHSVMMEQYNTSRGASQAVSHSPRDRSMSSRPVTPSSLRDSDDVRSGSPMSVDFTTADTKFSHLSSADLRPTYAPLDQEDVSRDSTHESQAEVPAPQLGCAHYKRNVKLQCYACKKWYTCRFCHDEVEDHALPRQSTENMLCMICKTPQSAAGTCKLCGDESSCYYCSICKLWNNDPAKAIYHCDDCGICRLGEGLGKDFFHCPTCAVCMSIGVQSTHRCIERSTKCDCPICGEYLFTSSGVVVFMRCGHSIHDSCFKAWCRASYKCPICSKSVINMESQFRSLDRQIEGQPMPEEYQNTKAYVYCNDCSRKGTTRYHWLGLKCETCESYNTQQHHLVQADGSGSQPYGGGDNDHEAEPPVTASPLLPQNVSDEAVAIPNSTAASRRPSTSHSETGVPGTPPRPTLQAREARSLSPTAGNYFGTGLSREDQSQTPTPSLRSEASRFNFWGRAIGPRYRSRSPTDRRPDAAVSGIRDVDTEHDRYDIEEEEEDDDDDDDDDEFEDELILVGHR